MTTADHQTRPEIISPCKKICVIDNMTDICIGCGRRRQEIAAWRNLSDEQRQLIMATLDERMTAITQARRQQRRQRTVNGAKVGRAARLAVGIDKSRTIDDDIADSGIE